MKRASVNFQKSHAVDEEARARLKHQTLLQEYLELQKEFVSKKRRLQTAKQTRETLLTEVRFLRQRHKNLLKIQSPKLEPEKDLVRLQNSDIKRRMLERERSYSIYETALENQYPPFASTPNSRDEEEEGEASEFVREPLRIEKIPKGYLIDERRLGQKKISWRDQVTLKV